MKEALEGRFGFLAGLSRGKIWIDHSTADPRMSKEMAEMVEVKRQRKILNALQTKGRLSLSDAALEVDATLDQVKQDVYDLVGKGLFSGYIDWQDGILYSRQARALRDAGSCPNCNGQLELAGKGIIKCPYCDTEIFL